MEQLIKSVIKIQKYIDFKTEYSGLENQAWMKHGRRQRGIGPALTDIFVSLLKSFNVRVVNALWQDKWNIFKGDLAQEFYNL